MSTAIYISLGLTLLTLSCVGGGEKTVTKVVSDSINVITFDMTATPGNNPIGTRSMGKAKSGEQLEDCFAVKNMTEKPIVILEGKTNCGCVKLDYTKEPIKEGERRVIKYTYDSRGKIGMQFTQITIKTTAGEYKVLVDLDIK